MSPILLQSGLDPLFDALRPFVRVLVAIGIILSFVIASRKQAKANQRREMPVEDDEDSDETDLDPTMPDARDARVEPPAQTALEDRVRQFMEELKRQNAPEAPAPPPAPKPAPMASGAPRVPHVAPPPPPITASLRVEAPAMELSDSPSVRKTAEAATRKAIAKKAAARGGVAIDARRIVPRTTREWRQAILMREVLGPPKALESER